MTVGVHKMRSSCVLIALCLVACAAQTQNKCNRLEKCDACIQTAGCMWCSEPKKSSSDDEEALSNCQPITEDTSSFCDPENLENPKNEKKITLNEPLTTIDAGKTSRPEEEKIVQLSPQGMRLKLRKGTPETIRVTYRQAQDYPVDLYYLMDLSYSMRDDKAKLATLGDKLTDTLKNLTTKFTIGFGSFVDKVMMPYADMSPEKLESPCPNCTRTYCFRNNLPLGSNASMFTERVQEATISGNLDAPEGGFDALMQAMVCKEAIGWRNQSRRIIVYSTDDKFHYAGDGRLAGIITPNDERCHLNEDGDYEDFDKYDYPSIGQIDKVSKRENINIIFAVSGYEDLYEEVSKIIKTSSFGLMNNDSSNVVELVVKQYKEISSQVQLTDNSTNSPVSIKYKSSCKKGGSLNETQQCSGISQGTEVTFHLEVELEECPKDQKKVIVEVKTLQDSLLLEIEIDCNCNCETQGRSDNSSVCHNKGDLVCGVCDCSPNYQGKHCMCSISDASDGRPEDEQLCKAHNENRICSGQGYCNCGKCDCLGKEITGEYCQCNSRKCLSGGGGICSGRGTCECDKCSCDADYHGEFCQCEPDSDCVKPDTLEVCSDHGTCNCGRCSCNQTYSGKYCEDCVTCRTGKCLEFKDCVQCQFSDQSCECKGNNIIAAETLKPYTTKGAKECSFDDENGCYFKFSYLYRNHDRDRGVDYDIHILKEKECPKKASIMGIIFGLVAAIVAIGLLTLIIWKVVTTLHDRKEYARFEDEAKQGAWSNDSRMYVPPIQTTENPMFSQNI